MRYASCSSKGTGHPRNCDLEAQWGNTRRFKTGDEHQWAAPISIEGQPSRQTQNQAFRAPIWGSSQSRQPQQEH